MYLYPLLYIYSSTGVQMNMELSFIKNCIYSMEYYYKSNSVFPFLKNLPLKWKIYIYSQDYTLRALRELERFDSIRECLMLK